jgi:hypothetical protein
MHQGAVFPFLGGTMNLVIYQEQVRCMFPLCLRSLAWRVRLQGRMSKIVEMVLQLDLQQGLLFACGWNRFHYTTITNRNDINKRLDMQCHRGYC